MNTTITRDQSQTLAYTRDVAVARKNSPEPNRHQRRHLVRLGQVNPVSFLRGYLPADVARKYDRAIAVANRALATSGRLADRCDMMAWHGQPIQD